MGAALAAGGLRHGYSQRFDRGLAGMSAAMMTFGSTWC
jgi:Ca2+/H+ antiporter